ncbi:PREDICTED: uncharacterized protein LOC104728294 [Camelina sativa]|uniref:Uncharacterized protein LOC104728294 n=1 Tax=Camelina sativa TaxID=90675 RepID=A0ABM0USL0_CAMSA|nr:PREDICTED: uncharacterized protein LOC104728294 [Camelina sativa]
MLNSFGYMNTYAFIDIQGHTERARHVKVQEIDEHQFQVSSGTSIHVVNLRYKSCSCRRFDLERMSCVHAIAAAYTANQSVILQFHPNFRKDSLCSGYANSIMPIDTSCIVPIDVTSSRCKLPFVRNPPGRPKMSRMKSFIEVALETKWPRKKHACSQCQEVGHNHKTCPANT